MITKDAPMDDQHQRFNSITSLKAAHTTLLKNYKDNENDGAQLDEIDQFIRAAVATGALLDNDNDRFGVQSLIDYWVTVLYRGKRTPPDATLVEFDPSLLPQLDDSLCPYRGLNAFEEVDKDIFFGRQRLLEILLKKVTTRQVLFVVGPSGSGKSSLVLAGLLPALKNGLIPGAENRQYIPPFVPGSDPLRSLAWALGKGYKQSREWVEQQVKQMKEDANYLAKVVGSFSEQPAVVVIDQFEEVFTLCLEDTLRKAFIDNLLSLTRKPSTGHQVIVTLRTDYETYLAHDAGLMSLFEEGQVRVMPLTASELRSAIEEPARRINLRFEEGVVDSLVKDILGEPEGLPLLQFTLLRLWKTRENGRNRVTLKEYRKLGGARRALALTADEFYQSLTEANRITLQRIMLRLALPSGNAEVLRNTVKREALYFEDPRRVNDVLDKLAEAGLIRVTEGEERKNDKIEIAHEALVRHWPTLVGWIDKERVLMRQRLRLTSAAQQWLEHGKDEGGLLGGSLLAEALKYEALNDLEKEFVAASQEAANRAERQKEKEQRQKTMRLRQFASVVTVLLVAALAAAIFGLWQARQASANARLAQEKAALAQQNYDEAVKQTTIAQQQQQEALRQGQIAEARKQDMEQALLKAREAEALAKTESEKAKRETRRAIAARNDANKYLRAYENLLAEKTRELELRRHELELRKQRDEANATLKKEQLDRGIALYETLLEKLKARNDLKGQTETLSQLSRAYERVAERAERRRDTQTAEKNHAKSVKAYEDALNILETESKKEIEASGNNKEGMFLILWEKAQFFREHNRATEAEGVYLQALAVQEELLTPNDSLKEESYDNIVENLIDLYRSQPGKLEALYRQVLNKKRLLHPVTENPEVYRRLRDLASFLRGQDRLKEVEALYREALTIMQDVIKKEGSESEPAMLGYLIESLTDLAHTLKDQGNSVQAQEYYRQALEKQRQKVTLENAGQEVLADIQIALAETLREQNKNPEAMTAYVDAVKLYYTEKDLNPRTLTASLNAIAEILRNQGEPEKIEQRYQESLSAFQGNELIKNAIAESLIAQANNLYKTTAQQPPQQQIKSFKVAERLIGLALSSSPTVQNTTTDTFASALRGLLDKGFTDGGSEGDNLAEIENLLKELLDTKEQSLNAGERRVDRSIEQLLLSMERMYRNRDEQKLASLYQRALTIRTQVTKGTDNPQVYAAHNDLAKLLLRLGRYAEAKETYGKALGIVERVFGKTNGALVVDSLLNLAAAHVALKEYAEAEKLFVRARSNLETNKRDTTVKMAEVLESYSSVLKSTGRLAEATKLMQNAQDIRNKLTTSIK